MTTLSAAAQPEAEPWLPPEPSGIERDWIKLSSGEWLNGEILLLRDRDLTFDSEELDELDIDWADVSELRSSRVLTYRFEDIGIFAGTATMKDDVVVVRTRLGVVEHPREKLIVIIEGAPREINYWSSKTTLGVVARQGNTNQVDFNAYARLRRQAARTVTNLRYTGNGGRIEEETTINNHTVDFSFDAIIAAGFFVTPVAVNYNRDTFQNLDSRYIVGASLGYFIMRGGDIDWNVGAGGGYVTSQYNSVEAGQADRSESGTLTFSTEFEIDITSDVDFTLNYDARIGVPDPKESFHTAAGVLGIDLFGDIFTLDLAVNWERVEQPRADSDGKTPERDDFRSSVGIGVDF